MNYLNQVLKTYLIDIEKEMTAARDYDTLKMIHDMGLGALLYCYNAGIISEQERLREAKHLNDRYGNLWQKHIQQKNQ